MVGDWRPTLGYWGSLNFCSTIISKVNFHVDEHTLLREKAALHFLGFIIFAAANTSHGCYIVNDWYYLIMRHSGSLIIFALYIYMIMDDIYMFVYVVDVWPTHLPAWNQSNGYCYMVMHWSGFRLMRHNMMQGSQNIQA